MHLLDGKSFQEGPGEDSLLHTAQNRAEIWKKERRGRTTFPWALFYGRKIGSHGSPVNSASSLMQWLFE